MSASHPPKTNPTPNFFSTYSVILPVSLQTAYRMLGTDVGHDRVCHLSKLCTSFELLGKDEVSLPVSNYPEGKKLSDVGVRTAAATSFDPSNDGLTKTGSAKTFKRQHFTMEKTLPIIFGLFKKKVKIVGTLTWDDSVLSSSESSEDDSPAEVLYESLSDSGGVLIWKLRTFDKVYGEPNKTRVTERIEGWAPARLQSIVRKELVADHHAHMELYHTLF